MILKHEIYANWHRKLHGLRAILIDLLSQNRRNYKTNTKASTAIMKESVFDENFIEQPNQITIDIIDDIDMESYHPNNETNTKASTTIMKESVFDENFKEQPNQITIDINEDDFEMETNDRNNKTLINTTTMEESVCDENSNEQPNQTIIEITDNIEMETKEITPHAEPIQNHSPPEEDVHSIESDTSITVLSQDSSSSAKDVHKHFEAPRYLDSDGFSSSYHDTQKNRYLFNIRGRITLDEMRQRYTTAISANKLD